MSLFKMTSYVSDGTLNLTHSLFDVAWQLYPDNLILFVLFVVRNCWLGDRKCLQLQGTRLLESVFKSLAKSDNVNDVYSLSAVCCPVVTNEIEEP